VGARKVRRSIEGGLNDSGFVIQAIRPRVDKIKSEKGHDVSCPYKKYYESIRD